MERRGSRIGQLYALSSLIAGGDLSDVQHYNVQLMHPREDARLTSTELMLAIEHAPTVDGLEDSAKQMMQSSSRSVRAGAAERLASLGTVSATRALDVMLTDQDQSVRRDGILYICGNTGVCDTSHADELAKPSNIPAIQRAFHRWLDRQ